MNPREMADKVITIPKFCRGRYIVTSIAPSKGKTTADNIMAKMQLASFETLEGEKDGEMIWSDPIKMIEAGKTEDGELVIDLPNGVGGMMAMIYSGPYGFRFKEDDQWFRIADEKYTREYFMDTYGKDIETPEAFDVVFEEYLLELYNFKLQVVFKTQTNIEPGMVVTFYRKVMDKKEGQKYHDILVTKYADGYPELDGSVETVGDDVVIGILEAIEKIFNKKNNIGDVPF